MKITQREVGDVVVLDLNGKLQGGPDAETFRDLFKSLIDAGKKKVVVNLEKVNWINSTGLGILISGYTSLRKADGDLVIMRASDRIESILYVTKLNLLFKSFDNEEDAVRALSENAG